MPIKIGDIKGVVPEKKQLDGVGEYITGKEVGRNEVITEVSPKKIGHNLNKLEEVMHEAFFKSGIRKMNPYDARLIKVYSISIIAKEHETLEVKT